MTTQSLPGETGVHADPPEGGPSAAAAILVWRAVRTAMVPMIGKPGFSDLYGRCVAARSRADPWLAAAHADAIEPGSFEALQTALSERSPAEVEQAQRELLRLFRTRVVSLLGEPLTTRLLAPGD